MRDTAGVPQPTTNPKTGHQTSRQGLDQNEQKCQIWSFLGKKLGKIESINSNHDDKHTTEEKSKSQKKTKETEGEGSEEQAKQLEEGEIL